MMMMMMMMMMIMMMMMMIQYLPRKNVSRDLIHDSRHLCTCLGLMGQSNVKKFLRERMCPSRCENYRRRVRLFQITESKVLFMLKTINAVAAVDVLTANHNDIPCKPCRYCMFIKKPLSRFDRIRKLNHDNSFW